MPTDIRDCRSRELNIIGLQNLTDNNAPARCVIQETGFDPATVLHKPILLDHRLLKGQSGV